MQPTPPVESTNFIIAAFQGGSWGMIPIAIVMVFVIFIIFERYMTLSKMSVDKKDFNDKLFGFILRGDIRQAITFCDSRPAPLTNTLKAGLVQVLNRRPDEEVQVAMDGAALKEVPVLDGWTGFLAVFGNVATLLGLLGTIIGLIHSFRAVTNADPAQKATLSVFRYRRSHELYGLRTYRRNSSDHCLRVLSNSDSKNRQRHERKQYESYELDCR